jgi:peptidoglycan/xylan/chitin deacetylase (PgdA/CDA1 family)
MTKKKKVTLISNLCIAVVLIGLGIAVFTADLTNVFISVSAPIKNGNANAVSMIFAVDEQTNLTELNKILDILDGDAVNAKTNATFFVGGAWAAKNADLVKRISKDFEIGNHGYSNKNLAKLSEKAQYGEIEKCHSTIHTITAATSVTEVSAGVFDVQEGAAVRMNLFLPPNGSFDKKTLKSAEKLGYKTVMWSRDATVNTANANTAGAGDFILFEATATLSQLLPAILRDYRQKNLAIVSISDNL